MKTKFTTPRGSVSIRPAGLEEAQKFRDLRLEALKNHPQAFSSDYLINAAYPPSYWVGRLQALDQNRSMYFAVHEKEFIGMCGIYREESPKVQHSATLVSMYVKPEWRGIKVADALIERNVEWASENEVKIVKLGVNSINTDAIHCYARCGFKEYGLEPQALYVNGVMYDMLLMVRVL